MKKIILIILVIAILCGGLFVVKKYSLFMQNTEDQNTPQISKINNDSLKENQKNNSIFEIKKINSESFTKDYTIENQYEIITEKYFKIDKKNQNLVINIINSENNEALLLNGNGIDYNKEYIIDNVESEDVKSIFVGGEGQDLMYPAVYILMKNGTIKGVDTESGYKTGTFEALNIIQINHVKKIEQASVSPANDSGYEAIIAITENDEVYEIVRKQIQ